MMELTIKSHSYRIPIKPYLKELHHNQLDLLPIARAKFGKVKDMYEYWIRVGQHEFKKDVEEGKLLQCTINQMRDNILIQLRHKKKALTYYEDSVRFLVCLRQQKLKKALHYHKICETYERELMDLICEGQCRQLELTNLEEEETKVITGESEQARKGCEQMMDFYNKRQRTLDSLIRCTWLK